MAKANVELSSFLINFTKMFHNQLCGPSRRNEALIRHFFSKKWRAWF